MGLLLEGAKFLRRRQEVLRPAPQRSKELRPALPQCDPLRALRVPVAAVPGSERGARTFDAPRELEPQRVDPRFRLVPQILVATDPVVQVIEPLLVAVRVGPLLQLPETAENLVAAGFLDLRIGLPLLQLDELVLGDLDVRLGRGDELGQALGIERGGLLGERTLRGLFLLTQRDVFGLAVLGGGPRREENPDHRDPRPTPHRTLHEGRIFSVIEPWDES